MKISTIENGIDVNCLNFDLSNYSIKYIPKKNGWARVLQIPNTTLKELQKRYLNYLTNFYSEPKNASFFSYRKDYSVIDNARFHLREKGGVFYVRMDLKEFFQSIDFIKTKTWLSEHIKSKDSNDLIERICNIALIHSGNRIFLPTWSPLSPYISNIVGHYLIDLPVRRFISTFPSLFSGNPAITYTRYSDDLIFWFTAWTNIDKIEFVRKVNWLIIDAWFQPNISKLKLMSEGVHQKITGITVNSGSLSVAKKIRDDVLFYCWIAERHWLEAAMKKWNSSNKRQYSISESKRFVSMLVWKLNWILQVMGDVRKITEAKKQITILI